MRRLILIFLVISFASCSEQKKDQLRIIQDTELATGEVYDSIFLAFRFKMSEEEFNSNLDSLKNSGYPVSKKSVDEYVVNGQFFGKIQNAVLYPKFHSNMGLYDLHVIFADPDQDENRLQYFKQYLEQFYGRDKKHQNDEYFYWIKGNRKISLSQLQFVYSITYNDFSFDSIITKDLMDGKINAEDL